MIFAEDEKLMRRGLDILAKWCEEWSVKISGSGNAGSLGDWK